MRLNYKRGKLVGLAVLIFAMGFAVGMIGIGHLEGRRGFIGFIVAILGPAGAQALMIALGTLCAFGALRLIWLCFDGALAVQTSARGVLVRSMYFTGHLPWAAVCGVDSRCLAGWGKHPLLVIHRRNRGGLLQRLALQGAKVVVQPKLLDADDQAIAEWIAAAQERGEPRQVVSAPPRRELRQGGFGRRTV